MVVREKGKYLPLIIGYSTCITLLYMLCELYTFGCNYLESLVLIAMPVPTQDLLLRLYIGELRGRNISTMECEKNCSHAVSGHHSVGTLSCDTNPGFCKVVAQVA